MEIDYEKVKTMTTDEIENMRVEVMKELQKMRDYQYLIREELSNINKSILTLNIKKQDLTLQVRKASQNIMQTQIDADRLKSAYFRQREGF